MKNGFLLLCAMFLIASFSWAQDANSQMSDSQMSNSHASSADGSTVQGCLSGSDGAYMLTQDGTGTMFSLVGGDTMLKKHVGHEVAVTGQASGSGSSTAGSQGQMGSAASGSNSIQVTDVKMISKRCNSGAGSAH